MQTAILLTFIWAVCRYVISEKSSYFSLLEDIKLFFLTVLVHVTGQYSHYWDTSVKYVIEIRI